MKKKLTPVARKLRYDQTPAESKLWTYLRSREYIGHKFRRQFPLGRYIVDFCCPEKKIIIELDGSQHNEPENIIKDRARDNYLKNRSYQVLRFWNSDIDENIDGVLEEIFKALSR